MENNSFEQFTEAVRKIADGLSGAEQFVSPVFVQDFVDQSRRVNEYANEIMNTNRDLKIGIVGQVKAGKSSFLNAMIFDGNDILPKAATPMTAALTKICYAEEPSAKVVFYSNLDWEVVEQQAQQYDDCLKQEIALWKARKRAAIENARQSNRLGKIDETLAYTAPKSQNYIVPEPSESELQQFKRKIPVPYRSCKELVEMVSRHDAVLEKLGLEETVSIENLEQDLKQYVGADGMYTPIVKYIELGICNHLVKGIQIVDTPGLGDPITSRSEKTKEFLMACDAVFLLSPSSQFMKREDVELIMNTLPGDGINRAVLVGSKFDSAMLDDKIKERQPLRNVLRRTRKTLNESAKIALSECRKAEKGYVHSKILERLENDVDRQIKEGKSLYYTASLIHNAACHMERNETINDEEKYIIELMDSRFDGMSQDTSDLKDLAGIDRLRNIEFARIRKEKDDILAERSISFAKDQCQALQKQLNAIQMECEQNLRFVQSEDIELLQKKRAASQEALIAMRRDIQNAFEICASETKNYMVNLAIGIKARAEGHTDIHVSEGSTSTNHSEKTGMLWWKKTEHWTTTEYFKAADVADAINNIHQYIWDAESAIASEMNRAIEIDALRNKIKGIVLRSFEKADANYDENDVINPVEALLKRLTVPEFNLVDAKKYEEQILDKFPNSRVTGEAIADLRLKQKLVLAEISSDISSKMEQKTEEIEQMLNQQAIHFTDDIKKQIEAKIQLLTTSLQDKQGSIEKYNAFLKHIADYKQELREFIF